MDRRSVAVRAIDGGVAGRNRDRVFDRAAVHLLARRESVAEELSVDGRGRRRRGRELRRVFSNLLRIVFRLCTDIGQRRRLFRLQLAVGCQFLQPVRIRHIVNIPEVFPLPVLIDDLLVVAKLREHGVLGKDQLPVQR